MEKCWVNYYFVFVVILTFISNTSGVWMCEDDDDCTSFIEGGVCINNVCTCPVGFQLVDNGKRCAAVAPYHFSNCVEDFQCSRLMSGFHCHIDDNSTSTEGTCRCLPDRHYFLGRCWVTRDLGQECTRNEECQSPVLINPFAMECQNNICVCSEGYFFRQRGECRKIGQEIGSGCVLDIDCQFPNGVCDFRTFTCYDSTVGVPEIDPQETTTVIGKLNISQEATQNVSNTVEALQSLVACRDNDDCEEPFICSTLGLCTCPVGYFSNDGRNCLAEIGSPATEENCQGIFSILVDGRCGCPANFFAKESMRDCVKATARFGDACVSDPMCHTFGAAGICGPPGEWKLRSCECDTELAVKEEHNSLCRLFSAIGEVCEVDSDCMAGNVEIECRFDEEYDKKLCACPEGLLPFGNLCLDGGLVLGDPCQVTQECTGTNNTVCLDGYCTCDVGYAPSGNYCLPAIGSVCTHDDDCIISNTTCQESGGVKTCQCDDLFIEDSEECWLKAVDYDDPCEIDLQCTPALGEGSFCSDGVCRCDETHHYIQGQCWRKTGFQETCTRSIMCFLGENPERVVCRNSRCECDFAYVFDQQLNTCVQRSFATNISGGVFIIFTIFTTQLFVIKQYFGV